MATITISRQYGSNGNEIAKEICKNTGYSLFDKYIIAKVADEIGLSDQEVIDFSEENYKIQGFFDRLFNRSMPVVNVWVEGNGGVRVREQVQLTEENALSLVRRAIQKAYQMGNIVIVGRGGQEILKQHKDVLHVRIEAPLEERIQRVRSCPLIAQRSFADPIDERRAAQDLIHKKDTLSENYLQRFYGVDWADPYLYHLIINTSRMSIERAAKVIIEAAQQL